MCIAYQTLRALPNCFSSLSPFLSMQSSANNPSKKQKERNRLKTLAKTFLNALISPPRRFSVCTTQRLTHEDEFWDWKMCALSSSATEFLFHFLLLSGRRNPITGKVFGFFLFFRGGRRIDFNTQRLGKMRRCRKSSSKMKLTFLLASAHK